MSHNISSEGYTLVDFWAPWCGPCKRLEPELEKVKEHFQEKLSVIKINIDEYPDIATSYNVMSIPTLIIFVNGVQKERKVSYMNAQDMIAWITPHMQA